MKFRQIQPELNRIPLFRQEWQSPFYQDDEMANILMPVMLNHPRYGLLRLMLMPQVTISAHGDLYLFNFVALDAHTAEVCQEVNKRSGMDVIRLADWLAKS